MQNQNLQQLQQIQIHKGRIASACIGASGKDVYYYMQLPDGRALLCRRFIDSVENPMEEVETCEYTYMTLEEFQREFKDYDRRGADVYYVILPNFGIVAYFRDWYETINASRMIVAPWIGEPILTIDMWWAEKYAKEMCGPEVARAVVAVREFVRRVLDP